MSTIGNTNGVLFEQDVERFEFCQLMKLGTITAPDPLPTTPDVGDMLWYDDGTETRPVYWNGDDWVDVAWGFFKVPGIVPGTEHLQLTSRPAAAFPGISTSIDLTPFAVAISRSDGSCFLGLAADDAVNANPRAGFAFAKADPLGLRWEFMMEGQDTNPGVPTDREGSDFRIRSLENQGPNGPFRTDFEIIRTTGYVRVGSAATGAAPNQGGVVFPPYDLLNNPPAVVEVGLTVMNIEPTFTSPSGRTGTGLYSWDGGAWV